MKCKNCGKNQKVMKNLKDFVSILVMKIGQSGIKLLIVSALFVVKNFI